MIAQYIDFTRDYLKASRIQDYGQLKKIPCGNKRQARARVIHEIFGLGLDTRRHCIRIPPHPAGIAQLVEHNLAKVGVASSNLVSRSSFLKPRNRWRGFLVSTAASVTLVAEWQSGYAAACKAVDLGSIPGSASISPSCRNASVFFTAYRAVNSCLDSIRKCNSI